EDMLERLTRLKDVDALPRIKMSTPEQFFKELEDTSNDLCKWIGELYLELHQGTFTTQAMIKKYNRKLEILLHDLELTASMAMLANASYKYPQEELSEMWKKLLLNQFHDVLPGSCIALVVEDALQLYKEVEKVALTALTKARNSLLSAKQSTTGTKLLAFNTYSWERTEVVSLPSTVDTTDETPIKKLKTSVSQIRDKQGKMLAVIHVPSMGYSELKPYEESLCNVCISDNSNGQIILENDSLRATIDNVGRIVSLVHKASKREAIATGCYGNQFVLYDDVPLFWDAWDVMDYHLETRKPVTTVKSPAYIVQDSTLSCAIAVSLQISEKSYIEQTISLDATSKYLKFDTKVEWNENRKFLKVEIPVTVRSLHASYDIQFGHLQRPTHGNTSWDWARYEVRFAIRNPYCMIGLD
ncbi:alpha-mannosidase 2C1-like, partial [Saccoglossus kowalevskii]